MTKKKWQQAGFSFLSMMILLGLGGLLGALIGKSVIGHENLGVLPLMGLLTGYAAILLLNLFLHILIHEYGHYVFGKRTGYRFVSFRVLSLMFVRENGKLIRKKFHIPGTAGQCLMEPPEHENFNLPYRLYNLGGGLLNLTASAAAMILCLFLYPAGGLLFDYLLIFVFVGALLAVQNLLPMKMGGMPNDGYNIVSFGKDTQAKRAFYLQLKCNALQTKGERLRDMNPEWFAAEPAADFENPLIVGQEVTAMQYYLDRQEFHRAVEIGTGLLPYDLIPFYRFEITAELLFCELIGDCRAEEIERLYSADLQKYIKQVLPYFLSKQRLLYAYELLYCRDPEKAGRYLAQFEKTASGYSNLGEAAGEKELISYIKQLSAEQEREARCK